NAVLSAFHAIKDCAPYSKVLTTAPDLIGPHTPLNVDPAARAPMAELALPTIKADTVSGTGPAYDRHDATDAVSLVLEIERNEAASMRKRSTSRLYRLTPTRTLFKNGIVYLAQDVGANNVIYATIYCAFNETDVDANIIQIGVEGIYSAILYDVVVSQQWGRSNLASGIITIKRSCFLHVQSSSDPR